MKSAVVRLAALFIKWAVVIEFIMFMAKGLIVGALYFLCIFKYKCKFFLQYVCLLEETDI